MIEQLYKDIYDEQLAKDAIINDRMEGFKEDYILLHILLRKNKIKTCFEIGTHAGWGTEIIKNALGESSTVYSLDLPYEDYSLSKQHPLSNGRRIGFECGLPFIQLLGNSLEFDYRKYPCEGYFIDGEHVEENVFHETTEVLRTYPKIVIWHDANMPEVYEGIIEAFNHFHRLRKTFSRDQRYELFRVTDTRIAYAIRK